MEMLRQLYVEDALWCDIHGFKGTEIAFLKMGFPSVLLQRFHNRTKRQPRKIIGPHQVRNPYTLLFAYCNKARPYNDVLSKANVVLRDFSRITVLETKLRRYSAI